MVLGGTEDISYTVGGTNHTIHVSVDPKSYGILRTAGNDSGTLDMTVGLGVTAYSYTFG